MGLAGSAEHGEMRSPSGAVVGIHNVPVGTESGCTEHCLHKHSAAEEA